MRKPPASGWNANTSHRRPGGRSAHALAKQTHDGYWARTGGQEEVPLHGRGPAPSEAPIKAPRIFWGKPLGQPIALLLCPCSNTCGYGEERMAHLRECATCLASQRLCLTTTPGAASCAHESKSDSTLQHTSTPFRTKRVYYKHSLRTHTQTRTGKHKPHFHRGSQIAGSVSVSCPPASHRFSSTAA